MYIELPYLETFMFHIHCHMLVMSWSHVGLKPLCDCFELYIGSSIFPCKLVNVIFHLINIFHLYAVYMKARTQPQREI